jgi:hypothetical protein
LGGTEESLSRRRPDFVVTPRGSVGVYSTDSYEEEVHKGIGNVLIVELKEGDFTVTTGEVLQAQKYVSELRKARLVTADTQIVACILGGITWRGR